MTIPATARVGRAGAAIGMRWLAGALARSLIWMGIGVGNWRPDVFPRGAGLAANTGDQLCCRGAQDGVDFSEQGDDPPPSPATPRPAHITRHSPPTRH